MVRLIFWLLIVVCVAVNSIVFYFDIIELLISFVNVILSYYYLSKIKSIQSNLASTLLFVYIVLSTLFCATIQIDSQKYSFEDFQKLAVFSNHLLLVFLSVTSFLWSLRQSNDEDNYNISGEYYDKMYSPRYVWSLLGIAFTLTIISRILGLGVMGHEAVVLPFKIGGIIMYMRKTIISYLFLMVFIKNRNDVYLKRYVLVYFCWALFECFVMLSKSILLTNFLPLITYILLSNNGLKKRDLKYVLVIVGIFFTLYPIIGSLRYVKSSGSFFESINKAEQIHHENNGDDNFVEKPFLRTFSTGTYYMNALPYIKSSESSIFDFSRLPIIVSMGGSAAYTTFVIEGYSKGVHHSSGTTGIIDPLLIGGYGFTYSMVLLLVLFANYIDGDRMKGKMALKVFLLLLFFDLVRGYTISRFLDPLAPSFVLTTVFLIFYLYRESKYVVFYEK